jgi:preprotein translocase subunit SecF
VISGEVAEFIEASTQTVKPREPLTLKIKSHCIDDGEKEIYRRAIRAYYTQKYISSRRELAQNRTIAILLALAGILVLALAFFVEYRHGSLIWAEVIDIVAWVFLWEAVDIAFLETRKLKLDRQKYIAYVMMNVEFEDT